MCGLIFALVSVIILLQGRVRIQKHTFAIFRVVHNPDTLAPVRETQDTDGQIDGHLA
jgi:hypothetical protein